MTHVQIALIAVVVVVLGVVARRLLTPRCPRCRSRKWDRKLCQPLLFCRSCATRCDSRMRVYN